MRTSSPLRLLSISLACSILLAAVSTGIAAPKILQFTATAGNTIDDTMTLDHPALNGKPNLKMIVTHASMFGLPGFGTPANNHPVGLQYDYYAKRWQVVNEDYAPIPWDAVFNVYVPKTAVSVKATPSNSTGTYTFFPLKKGRQDAILLFSHVINPLKALPGVRVQRPQGIWYTDPAIPPTALSSRWAIYNEDGSSPAAAAYTVADASADPTSFVLKAQAGSNIAGAVAFIDNPVIDGHPEAVVFVNHVFNPVTAIPNFLDKVIGVYYFAGRWAVFLEDGSDMPDGATFNVTVFPAVTP
jgi:hypothetical protein